MMITMRKMSFGRYVRPRIWIVLSGCRTWVWTKVVRASILILSVVGGWFREVRMVFMVFFVLFF